MTTLSLMGALGTIIGYHKNSNRADHIYVKISIYFMLIWYVMEYHVLCDDRGDMDAAFSQEEELKPLYTVALTAMSVSFGVVMAVFAGFLGGEAKGRRLEVCVFFVVSFFLSSVSLGMVAFRPPKKAGLGAAAMALACLTLVLLLLATLALVSYVVS